MKRLHIQLALSLLVIFWFTVAGEPAAADSWKAGAAKLDITPRQHMWMAGYGGRDHPSEGKLTELWAKALLLEDGRGERAALISLDLVGIDRELAQNVCRALHEAHGLKRRQIALCTSHTHTGPVVSRNLAPLHYLVIDQQQQKLVDQYAATLEKQIVEVVGRAAAKLAPATLAWGSETCTVAVNRRNNREADVPKLRAAGELKGPFDHDAPFLSVRDADGKLQAVVFGYACHATVLSFYQWSGDYPGFAQIALERSHPDCIALFWAGCGADQNPLPRRTPELAKQYGERLAAAVERGLSGDAKPVAATLSTAYRDIDLPLDTLPSREQIERDTQSKNKWIAARAKMLLAQIDGGAPLSQTYPYPVQCWRLGDDVHFVTLGGEVVIDYALRLKSELSGKNTWVAGYANDVMAYIPSRRVLREGGYEGGGAMVYYGLPTVWAPEVEKLIVDEVHNQVKTLE